MRCPWHFDEAAKLFGLKSFVKQSLALEYLEEHNAKRVTEGKRELQLFGREFSAMGHRYFVVEEPRSFFQKYIRMPKEYRTFYEIIRGGRPCRLYFDIEFEKTLNPGVEGETSMEIFRKRLVWQLRNTLSLDWHPDCFRMVEVDSSTDDKFSRHLIVTLPNGVVFKDNEHVGVFVNKLYDSVRKGARIDDLEYEKEKPGELESLISDYNLSLRKLFVFKKINTKLERVMIFDSSVYTRNRCFRLVLSAKFKDINKRHFKYYLPSKKACQNESLLTLDGFLSTLACYVCESKDLKDVIKFSDAEVDEWRLSRKAPHNRRPE